jgi:hypothetical protein
LVSAWQLMLISYMVLHKRDIWIWFGVCFVSVWLVLSIQSCGKQSTASPLGLNVQYQILNLSPDLGPVNLFIDFKQVNVINNRSNPFVFNINHNYFYVPSIDTPYQVRSALIAGTPIFSRGDILKPGLKYSLFITGAVGDGSLKQIFTVDTASVPAVGRGKIRLVNASPSATGGLDVFANGTKAFSKVLYTSTSKYIELPIGNYDIQINNTGSTSTIKDIPMVTIQDGRLYTLYAYGYTTRIDTAVFNAGVITNR